VVVAASLAGVATLSVAASRTSWSLPQAKKTVKEQRAKRLKNDLRDIIVND
jgi:hypothetical protein